jgi:hypothetical protein
MLSPEPEPENIGLPGDDDDAAPVPRPRSRWVSKSDSNMLPLIHDGHDDAARDEEEMATSNYNEGYKPAEDRVLARFIAGHLDWGKSPWNDIKKFCKTVSIPHYVFFPIIQLTCK